MTVIILGAGYATRLYPMTLGLPKALVEVGGITLIDRLLDGLGKVDRIIVLTNSRFFLHFTHWLRARPLSPEKVSVWTDGTNNDTDKLGAIADLATCIRECSVDDDLIVLSADNVFSHPLSEFVEHCRFETPFTPIIGVYDVTSKERARNFGVVTLGGLFGDLVVSVEEKPEHPTGTMVGVGLYYFPKFTVPLINAYIERGNNPDQPGRLIAFLCSIGIVPVRAWPVPGLWFDIGSKDSLNAANVIFKE